MTTTTSNAAPSLISMLHARYEANQAEFNRIEEASTKAQPYVTALERNDAEADALRAAILWQVPDSWADALILQYHIQIAHSIVAHAVAPSANEQDALETAMESAFDFLATERSEDHGEIGPVFQAYCNRAHFARRHRTGDMI